MSSIAVVPKTFTFVFNLFKLSFSCPVKEDRRILAGIILKISVSNRRCCLIIFPIQTSQLRGGRGKLLGGAITFFVPNHDRFVIFENNNNIDKSTPNMKFGPCIY